MIAEHNICRCDDVPPSTAPVPDAEIIKMIEDRIASVFAKPLRDAILHGGDIVYHEDMFPGMAQAALTALRSHYNVTITRKDA